MKKIIKNPLIKPSKITGAKFKGTVATVASLCVVCTVFFASLLSGCEKKMNCLSKIAGFYIEPQAGRFDGALGIKLSRITSVRQKSCDESNTVMCHTISSFSIKTIYDYSADFPSGSDITPLFKSKHYSDIITIDERIQLVNNDMDRPFYVFLTDDSFKGLEKKMKFEIRIVLSDDVDFVYQTVDLLLE